ncbi:MAG TPA: glutamyl-tRNA reductase [Blastocatellia bacterium]|jgi:glutamyl-tRNA reductase|nr:glutamyl-tRNA reductase [Blastocatellia bacterium]HCX31268.1 glutamyl-tRNA reductase [Blastocatellia bacterium]
MSIVLVGVNHKSAPIEVRERLAFTDEACSTGLRTLVDGEIVREGLIVSTCNRVEVLVETGRLADTTDRITQFLSRSDYLPRAFFETHLYQHTDHEAVRHLFRVTSSLDSMVVGEPQVLGQVRRAYSMALEAGTAGRILNRLVHHAFRVAKRVRSETGIGANAVSISYMAVELGKKIFNSLAGRTALLVGAGEMAELSARHLVNAGVSRVLLANRTEAPAERLARELGGEAVKFDLLPSHLVEADIVICSTAADHYVITEQMARQALSKRRNRPSFFIDISVPRNIDPAVGKIPNVFVFDIDDLESVISSNIREREREAERAELIVESEIMQFQQALRVLDIGPTIGALRNKLHDIARLEMARQRNRLGPLTAEQEKAVEALLVSTVNKISHPLLSHMRRSSDASDAETIQAWRDIFGLEE